MEIILRTLLATPVTRFLRKGVFIPIYLFSFLSSAQVSLTDLNSYAQDFNTLPKTSAKSWLNNNSLPGWYAQIGSVPIMGIGVTSSIAPTAGLYSLGTTNSTDRAIGGFSTTLDNLYYGVWLVNNSGTPMKNFTISYTVEQWYTAGGAGEDLEVSYRTGDNLGNSLVPLTTSTWTTATNLSTSSPASGSSGGRDGSLLNNQRYISATLYNIDLKPGHGIIIRWKDAKAGKKGENTLGIDQVLITPHNHLMYHAKAKGNLNLLTSWGINADGSGNNPASFLDPFQIFKIENNTAPTINAHWTVAGTGSKVILGDGSTAVNFTITPSYWFQGLIDVQDNSTLTLNNTTLPALGMLDAKSTVIYGPATSQNINAGTYGNLSLSGTGTKSLATNTVINGELRLNSSKLKLDNYTLRINPGGTITGAGPETYIITNGSGSLQQTVSTSDTDIFFPVGNTTYNPALIRQSASGTSDVFSVRVYNGLYYSYENDEPDGPAYTQNAIDRTWILEEAVAGGSDATLTIRWNAADALPGFVTNSCQVNHFENGSWKSSSPKSAVLKDGMYENSMSNISSFSPFGSDIPVVLPIELLNFTATQKEDKVVFKWQTASEINNAYFTLEQSENARDFTEVVKVTGAGASTSLKNYTYNLLQAPAKLMYYRLKQTDYDARFGYSKIIALPPSENPFLSLQVYPNPGTGRFQVSGFTGSQEIAVSITNLTGREVKNFSSRASGNKDFEIDLSDQRPGLYILQLKSNSLAKNIRLIKL